MEDLLREAGLGKTEAKVYLALLECEEETASAVAKKAGVDRSSAYAALSSLKEKNLAGSLLKNDTTYFYAADPERLVRLVEGVQQKILEALPTLKKRAKSTEKPFVTVAEGKEALKIFYRGVLNERKDWLAIGLGGLKAAKHAPLLAEKSHIQREKLGIGMKAIVLSTPDGVQRGKELLKYGHTEIRVAPKWFNSPVTTHVYGNVVSVAIYVGEPVIIFIRNRKIAQHFRTYFYWLWNICKRLK